MPANLRKTAPQRRFMPKLPIRHPQALRLNIEQLVGRFRGARAKDVGTAELA
jgi:hypothetical protein